MNNIQANEYNIFANKINYTLSPQSTNTTYIFNIFNIFNLHNPYKNNAYTIDYGSLYIQIKFNDYINDICRLEIYPDRLYKNATKNFEPAMSQYRIHVFYKDQNDQDLIYDSQFINYSSYDNNHYNFTAQCYEPQIINLNYEKVNQINVVALSNIYNEKNTPYAKISYVKIYQKISYDSYLLHSLVDDNLYQFNDDRSFTNIISYNDYINKTTSEKKEFFEKINCDKELSQLDKDIFHKFKIIKLDKDNIS